MEHFAEYAGLFGAALLAATILLAQSSPHFSHVLRCGGHSG
jgi:membrane protein YqaA with SNARE-associated domain